MLLRIPVPRFFLHPTLTGALQKNIALFTEQRRLFWCDRTWTCQSMVLTFNIIKPVIFQVLIHQKSRHWARDSQKPLVTALPLRLLYIRIPHSDSVAITFFAFFSCNWSVVVVACPASSNKVVLFLGAGNPAEQARVLHHQASPLWSTLLLIQYNKQLLLIVIHFNSTRIYFCKNTYFYMCNIMYNCMNFFDRWS